MRSIAIVKARVLGVGLICELDSGQYRFRPDNIAVSISVANYHFSLGHFFHGLKQGIHDVRHLSG